MPSEITQQRSGNWSPELTAEEHGILFHIAEDTLVWLVSGAGGAFKFGDYGITPGLEQNYATFVTLRQRGDLRGCIGCLEPKEALYLSVHRNTQRAARDDARFDPVAVEEVSRIEVDISILGRQQPIESVDAFNVGQHGIVIHKEDRSAVYLPQVASEQGWTREATLESLCHKAGLPADAWRENATMTIFESVSLHRAGPS